MSFTHGLLNLTNWAGNAILPLLTGLFFALAIWRYAHHESPTSAIYGGFLCLMVSGLLRELERFASQKSWDDPDVYSTAILTLVDWVCNVLMPVYAGLQVAVGAARVAAVTRVEHVEQSSKHFIVAGLCLLLSGFVRLAEFFVIHGTAGVQVGR